MRISDVQITLVSPKNGLIGFASMLIDEAMYISGIAIHQKLNGSGYRLTYPTRKSGARDFDLFHPINKQASRIIEQAIFQKLKDVIHESRNNDRHNCHQFAAE